MADRRAPERHRPALSCRLRAPGRGRPAVQTSKETFLHGLLGNEDAKEAFGGNCVSLPVAYVAVARRLGYPVKLVCSKEHVFCRWEGLRHPKPAWRARFNFDGAGNGFSIDPDEFYLSWPRKTTPEQTKLYDWLQSLAPKQELALFLLNRGHVLRQVEKDYANAQIAYAHSLRLWPTSRMPLYWLTHTLEHHWKRELAAHPDIYRKAQRPAVSRRSLLDDTPVPWWRTSAGRPTSPRSSGSTRSTAGLCNSR